MAECIGGQHPGRVAFGGALKRCVGREHLHRPSPNLTRRQPLIEVNTKARSLGRWIKPAPVDQFEYKLLVGVQAHVGVLFSAATRPGRGTASSIADPTKGTGGGPISGDFLARLFSATFCRHMAGRCIGESG